MQKPKVITIAIILMAATPVAAREMVGSTGPGPQPNDCHSYYQDYRGMGFGVAGSPATSFAAQLEQLVRSLPLRSARLAATTLMPWRRMATVAPRAIGVPNHFDNKIKLGSNRAIGLGR